MAEPKVVQKMGDSAGAVGSALELLDKMQESAKTGQIDQSDLDQLQAVLNVAVDTAPDEQPGMQDVADGAGVEPGEVEPVEDIPSSEEAPVPSDIPEAEDVPIGETPTEVGPPAELEKEVEEVPEPSEEYEKMEEKTIAKKVDEPMSARPPGAPNLHFDHVEDLRSKLPEFIKSMQSNRVGEAQKISGKTSVGFDTMFNMAQRALLEEGGWTSENLKRSGGSMELQKAITASDAPGYYLIQLAKLMLPVYAGLVNRLPTEAPTQGAENATWRAQLGFGSLDEEDFFRVAEGSIGVNPPTSFLTFNAPYIDTTANDNVTLKAVRAAAGYSDPLQIGVIKAMSALLRGQERKLLGGTRAAISAPGTVTVANVATSQSTMAAGSYMIGITALTYEGELANQKAVAANTVGETAVTAATQFVLASGSSMSITWAAVAGAVAYNVFVSGSGAHGVSGSNARWNQVVYVNAATVSAHSSGSVAPPSSDTTVNATYGMEGILSWCERETVLGNVIPSKQSIVDNEAGGLTAGNGGITEFDGILASLWSNWQTAPSLMVMSPSMNATLVGKLQSLGSGTFYRVEVGNERNTVNGGMMVTGYVNKFAPYADGTPRMIDVIPHPYLPDGTVLFLSETIPYPMGNESRGFVRNVLLPYTYFPLPSQASGTNTITYNFAITTSETLTCFNPGPQAALVGVDVDS